MLRPHYEDDLVTVFHGDCLEILRELPASSVDAVCTDPPYGLEFMGKDWDSFGVGKRPQIGKPDGSKFRQNMGTPSYTDAGNPTCRNCGGDKYRNGPRKCACANPDFGNPQAESMRGFQRWCEEWARECLRVLKPGGHLLAFGGTRTWHRLAVAVEDAGFEVRDSIAWLYGSGFPKSLDVSKAIDKAAGATREVIGVKPSNRPNVVGRGPGGSMGGGNYTERLETAPATDAARQWQGWGTALKPAFEPIVVARKPLAGTVAGNVLAHGTGALNIDASRTGSGGQLKWEKPRDMGYHGGTDSGPVAATENSQGRWPANVVLDGDQADELDRQSGTLKSGRLDRSRIQASNGIYGAAPTERTGTYEPSEGGASRFFPTFRYEEKAPASERPRVGGVAHPTVKPLDLMRWLVRLVTPPGGTVLEPFAGSGTTLQAAALENRHAIGIEREADYLPLIVQRLSRPQERPLFDLDGEAA